MRSNSLLHAGQNINEELGVILRNVRHDLSGAIQANGVQSTGLKQVEATLHAKDSELALKQLSRELVLATERASSLEGKLAEASHELDKLRADLEQAEATSKTDALTGLANRRALESFLRSEQIRVMEQGESLSVFLIDVDHFKNSMTNMGTRSETKFSGLLLSASNRLSETLILPPDTEVRS